MVTNGDVWVVVNNQRYIFGWQSFGKQMIDDYMGQMQIQNNRPISKIAPREDDSLFFTCFPISSGRFMVEIKQLSNVSDHTFKVSYINSKTNKLVKSLNSDMGLGDLDRIIKVQRSHFYDGLFYVFFISATGKLWITYSYLAILQDPDQDQEDKFKLSTKIYTAARLDLSVDQNLESTLNCRFTPSDNFEINELMTMSNYYLLTCGTKNTNQI